MGYSQGHAVRTGIGATGGAVTKELFFLTNGLRKTETQMSADDDSNGQRNNVGDATVAGEIAVGGTFTSKPRPDELPLILQSLTGAGSSPYTETDPLVALRWHIEKVGAAYYYDSVKINSATFESSTNGPLTMSLDLIGIDETSGAFPSIASSLSTNQFWMHHGLVLTLAGTTFRTSRTSITIANQITPDAYYNNRTRQELPPGKFLVTMSCDLPFNSAAEVAKYGIATAGITGSAVWTLGSAVLGFTFNKLQAPPEGPVHGGATTEVGLTLNFTARYDLSGGNPEVSIALTQP